MGDPARSREILSEGEDERRARDAPPGDERLQTQQPGQGSMADIVEDEDRRAPTPSPSASVPADEQQQRAPLHMDTESGSGLSRSTNQGTLTRSSNLGTILCLQAHPKCAKYVYGILFLGGIVLAMTSRDREVSGFSERVNGYNEDRYRLAAESALRIFFIIMFGTTVGTKKMHERRNMWNSNMGPLLMVKIAMLAGCLFGVEFIPSTFIQLYGNIARGGAWLYLAIQLISITRMIMWLNKWRQLNPNRWRWLLKAIAILSNLGSFGVIFWLLEKHGSDMVNFTIVIVTLMLMALMLCIYLKSEVTEGWVAPGIMMAYIVFMCWTVLRSEPHTKAKHPKGADWLTITCFVLVIIVMAYSTLSSGEDEWLQFNEQVPSEDDVPYGLGYFHLVFALGSMYFGMVFVGWNAYQTMQRWSIDFGWWSAVVRGVNGLLAAVLYIWMLGTAFIWNKKKIVVSFHGASWVPHATFV